MRNYRIASLNFMILFSFLSLNVIAQITKLNIKSFGAKGDGVTDDYPSFLRMADSVNNLKTAEIIFPEGNYYLAAYHTSENNIADILFMHCNGIKLTGKGAKISVNGNFIRAATRKTGGKYFSKIIPIIPLSFKSCSNIQITGLEISGNVDKMTRDAGVVEGGAPLIRLAQCRNVFVDQVNLNHSESDGIYITGDSSYNITVSNSIMLGNARQGMSVIGLSKGYFYRDQFVNTGVTDGNYGRHAPSDGVDIEPRYSVKNLVFEECTFSNNQGGQFICTSPALTSEVVLRKCRLEAGNSKRPFQLILYADGLLVDSCTIDCGPGSVWGSWKKGLNCKVEIRNSIIKSGTYGIYGVVNDSSNSILNIHDNKLYCTADTLKYYFPWIQMPHTEFVNNKIYFSCRGVISVDGYTSVVNGKGKFDGNEFISANNQMVPVVSNKGMQVLKTVSGLKKQ